MFLRILKLHLPWLCLAFFGHASAQQPVAINYTIDDGLPSNEVYDVFEDSLGYLWFATDHGISRFDGYEFKNFSTGDGLTHNTIFGFFEDRRHRVWMRLFNSTLCYMEHGRIYPYAHNDSLRRFLGRNFIQTFAIDSAGDLWFMSIREPFGLYRQDHASGRIERIRLRPGFNAFIRELDGGAYIAGVDFSGEQGYPDEKSTALVYADHTWMFRTREAIRRGQRGIVRVARSGESHYLFAYESELTEIAQGRVMNRLSLGKINIVTQLQAGAPGEFWVSCFGFRKYASDTGRIFFPGTVVNCVLRDKRGSYWLATGDRGVLFIPDINMMELPAGELRLIAQHDEKLFAVDGKARLKIFPLDPAGPRMPVRELGNDRNGSTTHHLLVDRQRGQLIYAGDVYETEELLHADSFARIRPKMNFGMYIGFARDILVIRDRVLVASNGAWGIRDRKGRIFYNSSDEGFSSFSTAICSDSSGQVWIGTADGLYVFREGRTQQFKPGDSLFRQRVTDMECLPGGQVIVSTRGGGVIVIEGTRTYSIRETDGLTTDLCGRLLIENDLFWVCSNKGLNKVQLTRAKDGLKFGITRINVNHGLPSNLVNDALRFGDQLILATGKGLAWFDVKKFSLNSYKPPVYINEVRANERLLGAASFLQHNENNLSFSFTGLLYNNPGRVDYRYRLDGYESDWHYTSERSVRYFNLPAGDYRFLVAAKNENGAWSEQPAVFAFTVPLHFSKTWWFRSVLALAIGVIIFLVVRYYLEQRRLRERITSDLLLAELNTLRSQMKPHFIFNSLNSIQHFILEHDEESAHLYLSRFSSLMRKILENTRRNTISLAREIETLELYLSLEKLRFGKNFDYIIEVAPELIREAIDIPPMLIQPYAENAIWHGLLQQPDDPRLALRFFAEDGALVCVIEDNGIGRKRAGELQQGRTHESTGMKNITERIAILNRVGRAPISAEIIDLYDAEGKAAGTKVVLKFMQALNEDKQP